MVITGSLANIVGIVFTLVVILLVTLFFISLVVFIKSQSRNRQKNIQHNIDIERKLDQIIALLEKKESDK
jgi:CHASE3 domain sensor protein